MDPGSSAAPPARRRGTKPGRSPGPSQRVPGPSHKPLLARPRSCGGALPNAFERGRLARSVVRTLIDATCPACSRPGLEYNAEQVDLPYLGESLETMVRCHGCGYRHTDFILTETRDPTRFTHPITEEADMSVRVVRSSSGTIRIPELGILIEPGLASEAFITNIEGIIVRIEAVLNQLLNDADVEETREKVRALQSTMAAMRTGAAEPATLIIDDPLGNSAILGERATSEPIAEAEAAKLKVGMFVFDQGQLGEEE